MKADSSNDDFWPLALHELSQPLTTLRGFLELELAGQEARNQPSDNTRSALQQADEIFCIFRALRDLAELEAPQPPAPPGRLDRVLCEVAETLIPVARSRDIELDLRCAPHLAPSRLSPERLAMVLHGLLAPLIELCPPHSRLAVEAKQLGPRAAAVCSVSPSLDPAATGLAQPLPVKVPAAGARQVAWEFLLARRALELAGGSVTVGSDEQQTQLAAVFPAAADAAAADL